MSSLPSGDVLRAPSTKLPIDITTFVSYIIPPVICYIIVAVLAVTPQTRAFRLALWPVVVLLTFRAAVSVDMSHGKPELKFLNIDLMRSSICIVANTLSWALAKKPLVRHLRPANSSPSIIMDALDLATNLRGHGWNWSRGLHVPRDTRPTNRLAFACYAFLSGALHAWICGVLHLTIQTFTAGAGSSPRVSTIFDDTLPFFVRYLRSSIIAALGGCTIYAGVQLCHDLLTVPAVLLLGQDPAQWPPAFDSPWRATSLSDFWARRWHQIYRRTFLIYSYPLSVILGRVGTVTGVFLLSGLFHHIMMTMFGGRSDMWRMLVPFGMMAPGVLAEWVLYRSTGRKVDGAVGWLWTMGWLLLWGNVLVDGFVRAGMFARLGDVDNPLPLNTWVQNSVIDFDAWLHTI